MTDVLASLLGGGAVGAAFRRAGRGAAPRPPAKPNVILCMESRVESVSGHIGNFKVTVAREGEEAVEIDDACNEMSFADSYDPDTTRDTGLFLNGTLLVQEGVTAINGQVVDSLRGVQDGYALSSDGGYVVFEATLANGLEGQSWSSPS